jgi:cobalt-zinc-cadmium efflux system outer membrane protein
MMRVLLPAAMVVILVLLPGCVHNDQDRLAQAAALEIAGLPRDQVARDILGAPKPVKEMKELPPVKQPPEILKLPPELPAWDAPPLVVPPFDPKKTTKEEHYKLIEGLYPKLPALETELVQQPGPGGRPLDLPDLQRMALETNPEVQQAVLVVQAARGSALQVGLYPNPRAGFVGDNIGQANTTGALGGFIEQTWKTANKLDLARAAATMDVRSAQLALRRTQADVMTKARSGYFAVLVAQENLAITRALAVLAEEVYRIQIRQVQLGLAAPYEPLQLHVLALQARGNVVQARNHYLSAWRQLAAALGQPDLPPMQLAGRADVPPPDYPFELIRDHMLNIHTDLGIARNDIVKAQYALQLARVTPIPDLRSSVIVQKDTTSEPHTVQLGVTLGIDLPVFNQNQGDILRAQAQLAHANREVARVEIHLNSRLAETFARYRNNLTLSAYYRDSILPNQVRVYRAIYQRYQQEGEKAKVSYNDVVVAQQTLAAALLTYLNNLAAQWQAVADLAHLLQTDDLYQLTTPVEPCEPPKQTLAQMLDPAAWQAADAAPSRARLTGPPAITAGT